MTLRVGSLKIGKLGIVISGASRAAYSLEPTANLGLVKLLKGYNLDAYGGFITERMNLVTSPTNKNKNLDRFKLQKGDVVILARGSAIRASFVTQPVANQNIIASANFIVIRPDPTIVRGEVIVAYLNSIMGRKHLLALSKGSITPNLSISDLRKFEIPSPSLEIQHKIAAIFHANYETYQATIALAEQQSNTANAMMLTLILGTA